MQTGRDRGPRIDDPEHWLERAEEARTIAEEMRDPQARLGMLAVAEGYERLAARAAERLRER